MSVHTRSQRQAAAAFPQARKQHQGLNGQGFAEYRTFVKKFPALVHTCGLAQAVSFAQAKGKTGYLNDLAVVLQAAGWSNINSDTTLIDTALKQPLSGYLRLSRDAIEAASWLKRYVEAVGGPEEGDA